MWALHGGARVGWMRACATFAECACAPPVRIAGGGGCGCVRQLECQKLNPRVCHTIFLVQAAVDAAAAASWDAKS